MDRTFVAAGHMLPGTYQGTLIWRSLYHVIYAFDLIVIFVL